MKKSWLAPCAVILVAAAALAGRWSGSGSASQSSLGDAIKATQVSGSSAANPMTATGANSSSSSTTGSDAMPVEQHHGFINSINMVLTPQQLALQNQEAQDLLEEHAMQPKILADGTKQFTLTASVFAWNLWAGETEQAWGYNGQVAGPLIRVQVGDKVELVVHNHLPEPTTVHWHGLAVPNAMDGVPNITQRPIPAGGTFVYRFTVTKQMVGTHYYHSHYDDLFQVDHGLYGPLIVDPSPATTSNNTSSSDLTASTHYDVDALYVLSSWITQGTTQEDAFSIDGKPYPNSPTLEVKRGETVRIRLINTSGTNQHVMQLDGYSFKVIAIDGNAVAEPQTQDTIALYPGETADIAFVANNPGRWMFSDHILSQDVNQGDDIDTMGGIVSFVDVQ